MKSISGFFAALLIWAIIQSSPIHAAEEILLFDSSIIVDESGQLIVEETIRVRAEGAQIRRGIYRDFPRRSEQKNGLWSYVGFELLEVLRDGQPEPHFTQNGGDFLRIYIGDSDVFIPTGEYTYTIRYSTGRQLRYFQNFDELFWNVTGNFWSFPIRIAVARITLPEGAKIERRAAYTGYFGARGEAYEIVSEQDNTITFATTRRLEAGEGLTLAIGWPKGFVAEPNAAATFFWKIWDNLGLVVLFFGTLGLAGFYYRTWNRIGCDPEKSIIIPLFTPPENLSPAAMSYVYFRGFDKQGRGATKPFIAAMLSLAAKGYMRIVDEKGELSVESTEQNPANLPEGEFAIFSGLLGHQERMEFVKKNGVKIKNTQSQFSSAITSEYEGVFFKTNLLYFVFGAISSLILFILYFWLQQPVDKLIGTAVAAFLGSVLGTTLLFLGLRRILGWLPGDPSKILGGLFVILGVGILGPVIILPLSTHSLAAALVPLCAGALGFMAIAYYFLVRAPTISGRKVLDEIEGFRLYLSVAEAERMNIRGAPDMTQQIYESYLPYAIGLGVEEPWSEAFAEHLAKTAPDTQRSGQYSPGWYRGGNWDSGRIGAATSGLVSAMSSSMASAMPAPKSSSGSGGGGFSGGGGGGGGGGGW